MRQPKNIRQLKISDFYCTQCGNKNIPIARQVGKQREPGHLKKLYCLYCNKETNNVEIKYPSQYTLDDFWIEYNYHNFDENGNRIEPHWRKFVSEVRQKQKEEE